MNIKTHDTILNAIIGIAITITIISVIAIITISHGYSGQITTSQHREVMNLSETNQEIRPVVEEAIADGIITGGEYENIIRIDNEIKRKRLFEKK